MNTLYEDASLRDCIEVFQDRDDAGERLARFILKRFSFPQPVVCPIPAGGVPIGYAIACALSAPLKVVVVRKIQIPWSTESGFGAVSWKGDVVINTDLQERLSISAEEASAAISRAQKSVQERIRKFSGGESFQDIRGHTIILTDDGLASGFTLKTALRSIRAEDPAQVVVAVPTGSLAAVRMLSEEADIVICLNIRGGFSFAVADAYRHWHDLTDEEVLAYLHRSRPNGICSP